MTPDNAPNRNPAKRKRRQSWLRRKVNGLPWWIRIPVKLGVVVGLLGLLTAAALFFIYGHIVKDSDLADLGKMPQRISVYDARSKLLGRLHGENRILISLDQVPDAFIDALIAREDRRFRSHGGVDYIGVIRATCRNIGEGRYVQGASTITMQLARNSFGLTERTLHRKLTEVMLARRIEENCSKDEILELYINRIFFGSGIYGLELASRSYFGKPASAMTLGESAMIAGIIRSPNRFSPASNFEGACRERDHVLDQMVTTGAITANEAADAKKDPIRVRDESVLQPEDNFALDLVRLELNSILAENDLDIEDGGLTVYTSIDADLQSAAEGVLGLALPEHTTIPAAGGTPDTGANGAVFVLNNGTGGIAAVVGGRSRDAEGSGDILRAEWETGNTIIPFVYATAYEGGALPGDLLELPGVKPDSEPPRQVTIEAGFVLSDSKTTEQLTRQVGLDSITRTASHAGLRSPSEPASDEVISCGLTATLQNLTGAFSIFANGGIRKKIHIIEKIEDQEGRTIYKRVEASQPVISAASAHLASRGLQQLMKVQEVGVAGREEEFETPAGGMGAPINGGSGAWFVGYTGPLTCGVWVTQNSDSNDAGGELAMSVWTGVMTRGVQFGYRGELSNGLPTREVGLCRISGRLSSKGCDRHGCGYTDSLPESIIPRRQCLLHDGPVPRNLRQ